MSTFLVKNTGTLSSGASTITGNDLVDWVDSNCRAYSAFQTILTAMADTDIIKFDDDTYDFAAAVNDQSNAVSGGTLNIETRSSDQDLCTFRITGNNRCLQFNHGTLVKNWNVGGMTITCATNMSGFTGGAYAVLMGSVTGNVTYNNFAVKDISSTAAIAATTGHLISSSGNVRTITFNNYEFSGNVTGSANEHGGMIRTNTGDAIVFNSGTITSNTMTSSGGNTNGFVHANGDITINTTTLSLNYIETQNGVGRTAYALINCQGNNVLSSQSVTFVSNRFVGGAIHAFGFYCEGTYTINDPIAYLNDAYETLDNSLGGLVVAYGANADGTVNREHVYNNNVAHGAGFYNSQGGAGTINSPHIHENTSHGVYGVGAGGGGGTYSGGDGDFTMNGGLLWGNGADEGGGIYLHLHTAGTRNKTAALNNVTVIDNSITNTTDPNYPGASGGKGIDVENGNATYSLTININNSIIMGNTNTGAGTTHQIDATTSGAGGTVINMDYFYVEGTAALEAPATGGNLTANYTNEITTTPTFEYDPVTGTTYRPANGSSVGAYTGKIIAAISGLSDVAGEVFPSSARPPIGGMMDIYGWFYPRNL